MQNFQLPSEGFQPNSKAKEEIAALNLLIIFAHALLPRFEPIRAPLTSQDLSSDTKFDQMLVKRCLEYVSYLVFNFFVTVGLGLGV